MAGRLEDDEPAIGSKVVGIQTDLFSFQEELWTSTDLLFQSKLTWLLVLGPIAVVGELTETLGPASCFMFAGMALIPCAERYVVMRYTVIGWDALDNLAGPFTFSRPHHLVFYEIDSYFASMIYLIYLFVIFVVMRRLSFITEQVAEHTNGTIGALLNATFGNAPELLISISALRSGYYRVVQLAMLGSMLTNMLLVFGVACVIGGMRWQVQELRITSGNVSMVMLLVATAGSLFPAALVLSGQLSSGNADVANIPSQEEITFCRVNSAVMFFLYLCYLVFQLGTHKEEFDDEALVGPASRRTRRNLFCQRLMGQAHTAYTGNKLNFEGQELSLLKPRTSDRSLGDDSLGSSDDEDDHDEEENLLALGDDAKRLRRKPALKNGQPSRVKAIDRVPPTQANGGKRKSKNSDSKDDDDYDDDDHPIHQRSKCKDRNDMHAEDDRTK
jgi:Ca2+/H+ antiporter